MSPTLKNSFFCWFLVLAWQSMLVGEPFERSMSDHGLLETGTMQGTAWEDCEVLMCSISYLNTFLTCMLWFVHTQYEEHCLGEQTDITQQPARLAMQQHNRKV
jgi:hypothetical protein